MKYEILVFTTHEELEEEVNRKLSEGWELQGGISHSEYYSPNPNPEGNDYMGETWSQAMIKK